jgi:hypothetical protein
LQGIAVERNDAGNKVNNPLTYVFCAARTNTYIFGMTKRSASEAETAGAGRG